MKIFFRTALLSWLTVFASSIHADTVTLSKNWNLVGINANLTLQDLKTKLGENNILTIQGVDKIYKNTNQYFLNNFTAFEPGQGYWIKLNNQAEFNFTPIANEDRTIPLYAGWNLINPMTNLTLLEIKTQIDNANLETVQGAGKVYKKSNPEFLNSFKEFEKSYGYWIKVNNNSELTFNAPTPPHRPYGQSLNKQVEIFSYSDNDMAVYFPLDMSAENKVPVILFVPGWAFNIEQSHTDYKSLLTFIASQGYCVFYAGSTNELESGDMISKFEELTSIGQVPQNIDTTRVGVVGHSYGGGLAYSVFKHFATPAGKGWGGNGRFIFTMAPWFAFDMTKNDFASLPSDTKVVNVEFMNFTYSDPRISLTLYNNLTSINAQYKDYQVYDKENANHDYPTGERAYSQMQGVLKPLDALAEYVFYNKQEAYNDALNVGTDNPYNGPQVIRAKSFYQQDGYYSCYGEYDYIRSVLDNLGIDYCAVVR